MKEVKPIVQVTDHALERRWRAIERKLAANAERLADQGSLVAMKSASGRSVSVVRFVEGVDGTKIHRSIYIGGADNPELLARTQLWLDQCRVSGRVVAEVAGHARLVAAACGAIQRMHQSLVPRR